VLIGLASLKLMIFAVGRNIRDIGERRPKESLSRR